MSKVLNKNKRSLLSILLVGIFALTFFVSSAFVQKAYAATCTASVTGNWNTSGTWSCGHVPTASDDVVIAGGTVTLNTNSAVALSLTVDSGATLNMNNSNNSSRTLTVGGNVLINNGGTITLTNSVNVNTHTLNVGGNFTNNGTFTAISATDDVTNVVLNGTLAQSIGGASATTFFNLTISNTTAAVSATNNFSIGTRSSGSPTTGTMTVNSNATFNTSTYVVSGGGVFTLSAGGTLGIGSTAGISLAGSATGNIQTTTRNYNTGATYNYNGVSAQVTGTGLPSNASTVLKINNATGVTLSVARTLGTVTIGDVTASSVLNDGGFQLTSAGTLNLTSGTFKLGSAGTATTWPAFGTRNISVGTTVEYAAGVAQTVSTTPSYQNLTFSGAGIKTTASGTLSIAGNWSDSSTTALDTNNTIVNLVGNLTGSGSITQGAGLITIDGDWTNNGAFTAGSGGVTYSGAGAQIVGAVTYDDLTIAGSGTKTASNDFAVGGALTLSNNLVVTDPKILTMGGSATTVGVGDVIGIVKRTTLVADTAYSFGNQFTTITLQNVGTLPTEMSIKLTLSAPAWKTGAITRTYDVIQTGESGNLLNMSLHYLDSELNGNTENKLVHWSATLPTPPGAVIEDGRANYDTTDNWVTCSSMNTSYFPTTFDSLAWTLADSALSNFTWNGSADTNWLTAANWTPIGNPTEFNDVIIPDTSTTPNDPTFSASVAVGRVTLESGGVLNATAGSTMTISGGSGAWSDNGGTFNASTSTVVFTDAIATISGETEFYNVTIDPGAGLTLGMNGIMRIAGTMTNNGTWPAAALNNATIEYNGGNQTILNPNGVSPGYDHLILSGSGTKTMPVASLSIGGDFVMSGTASATAGNVINTGGDFTIGAGNTFTMGAYSDTIGGNLTNDGTFTASGGAIDLGGDFTNNLGATFTGTGGTFTIGGDFTNDGAFTATGSTITFDGIIAQTIGGTTDPAFNILNISNTTDSVTATAGFSATGTMTVNSDAAFNASTYVVSGGGTFTLASGGTLGIGSTAGITSAGATGNIQTTTRNFNTGANYTYNGTANQAAGNGLPATVNDFTVNNTGGAGNNTVTLGVTETVNGTLGLTAGNIATGANNIYISSTGSVSGGSTASHVVGNLRKYITAGATARSFEIGDGVNYTPVDISFGNVSLAGDLTFSTVTGDCANIGTSTVDPAKSVNRCWTATDAGITFDNYSAVFNFVAGDKDIGADYTKFMVGKYSGGVWSYPTVGTQNTLNTQATGVTSFSDFQIGQMANSAPTGTFNSVAQKTDGSGDVDISIEVDDADTDNTKAKIEYETDSDGACDGPWATATLLGPTTADFNDLSGVPDINNASPYQVGSTANYRIVTSSGSNTITFDWDSNADLPTANGTQCLRLTVNDDTADQTVLATQTVTVDNVMPTVSNIAVNDTSITEGDVAVDGFIATIDFSEAMDAGTSPTVSFDPTVATTLTNCSGVWSDSDTYTYTCDIEDADVIQAGVDIDVSDAKDVAGNTMTADTTTGDDEFDVSTLVLSTDATLATVLTQAVTPTGGDGLAPGTQYTASINVANGVSSVASADAIATDAGATVAFYGTDSTYTTPEAGSIALTAGGAVDIYIKVIAEDTVTTLYYRVTINRAATSGGGGGGGGYVPPADTTPPTNTAISINNGATDTSSVNVTLTLGATDAIQMMISNDIDFAGSIWESFSTSKSWILISGDGTKTVYAKFRDSVGNVSGVVSDSIMLTTTSEPPTEPPVEEPPITPPDDQQPDKYEYELIYQSSYPSNLQPGETTNVWIEVKNTGTATWGDNVRLGSGSIYGSANQQRDYESEFANSDWLSPNRPVSVSPTYIMPGWHARFQFNIKAPPANGNYKAYFTPVADGIAWMNDIGIYWEINVDDGTVTTDPQPEVGDFGYYTVQPGDDLKKIAITLYGDEERWAEIADLNKDVLVYGTNTLYSGWVLKYVLPINYYNYQLISQSPYPSELNPGEVANVWIEVKNTGTAIWANNGESAVRLGTGSKYGTMDQQQDYASEFVNDDWLSPNRPVAILHPEVLPGWHTRFQFNIKAPSAPGVYRAYFTPVANGTAWMSDIGLYWEVRVMGEAGSLPVESTESVAPGNEYIVQSGDTLANIAGALLGDSLRWPELVELNKDRYPSLVYDPNNIVVGWSLRYF